eukprot:5812377-Pleurochrysis_carterae.AAC.1
MVGGGPAGGAGMRDSGRRARRTTRHDRESRAEHPLSMTLAGIHSIPLSQTMRAGRIGRPSERTGDRAGCRRAMGGGFRRRSSRKGGTGEIVEDGGRPRGGGPLGPARGADAPPSGTERSGRAARPIDTARAVAGDGVRLSGGRMGGPRRVRRETRAGCARACHPPRQWGQHR